MNSDRKLLQFKIIEDLIREFPEVKQLEGLIENNIWHENDDVLGHTFRVYRNTIKILEFETITSPKAKNALKQYFAKKLSVDITRLDTLILASIFHDIAKFKTFATDKIGNTFCQNHESIGSGIAKEILLKHGYGKKIINRVAKIIANHGVPHEIISSDKTDYKINKELIRLKKTHEDIFLDLIIHAQADMDASQLVKKTLKNLVFVS